MANGIGSQIKSAVIAQAKQMAINAVPTLFAPDPPPVNLIQAKPPLPMFQVPGMMNPAGAPLAHSVSKAGSNNTGDTGDAKKAAAGGGSGGSSKGKTGAARGAKPGNEPQGKSERPSAGDTSPKPPSNSQEAVATPNLGSGGPSNQPSPQPAPTPTSGPPQSPAGETSPQPPSANQGAPGTPAPEGGEPSNQPSPQPAPTPTPGPPQAEGKIPSCSDQMPEQSNTSDGWCRDTRGEETGQHGGLPQYRSYGTNTTGGQQCVYNPDGTLHTGPHQGTIDRVGPAIGENSDGTCNNSISGTVDHGAKDYLPFVMDPKGYNANQSSMRDRGVPSGSSGSGAYADGITDSQLEAEYSKKNTAGFNLTPEQQQRSSSLGTEAKISGGVGPGSDGEGTFAGKHKQTTVDGVDFNYGTNKIFDLDHTTTNSVGYGAKISSKDGVGSGATVGREETFGIKNRLGDEISLTIQCDKAPDDWLPNCSVKAQICGALDRNTRVCSVAQVGTDPNQVEIGSATDRLDNGQTATRSEATARAGMLRAGVAYETTGPSADESAPVPVEIGRD